MQIWRVCNRLTGTAEYDRIIYEIGLLNEGFSVIRKQNIESSDLSQNPILVGELLSVIQGYSMETSNEIPELFQIENFNICLQRFKCGGESKYYLLYAIDCKRLVGAICYDQYKTL